MLPFGTDTREGGAGGGTCALDKYKRRATFPTITQKEPHPSATTLLTV